MPGKHALKGKIGGKTFNVTLVVKEGEHYSVSFDPRKKKPDIKRLP
jgi:hypothetical protein